TSYGTGAEKGVSADLQLKRALGAPRRVQRIEERDLRRERAMRTPSASRAHPRKDNVLRCPADPIPSKGKCKAPRRRASARLRSSRLSQAAKAPQRHLACS